MALVWSAEQLVTLAAQALRAAEGRLCIEQSWSGLDALEETQVHPILAQGLGAEGLGVLREQPYPGQWRRRRPRRKALPEEPERQRCDLVLTPLAGQVIADSLLTARAEAEARAAAAETLFAALATAPEASADGAGRGSVGPSCEGDPLDPASAYWLEVKVVGQHCFTGGTPGPNAAYASQVLRGPTADLRKLQDDPAIARGAALLVLFTVDQATAKHDLMTLTHRCLDLNLPIRAPLTEHVGISDRIGNVWATVWLAELAAKPTEASPGWPGDPSDP